MFFHEHNMRLLTVIMCILEPVQGFAVNSEVLTPAACILTVVTITMSIIVIGVLCVGANSSNGSVIYHDSRRGSSSPSRRGSLSPSAIPMTDRRFSFGALNDPFAFPRQNLTIGKCIGNGQYGQVFLTTAVGLRESRGGGEHWDSMKLAVKTVKANAKQKDKTDFLHELELMKRMTPHKNVLQLLGCCTEQEPFFMIVEYMPQGNLKMFLDKNRKRLLQQIVNGQTSLANVVNQRQLLDIARQVADGMAFLSSHEFIHGDLATRNVLIGKHYQCKVSDFGRTRLGSYTGASYGKKRLIGPHPIRWMAIECLIDDIHTPLSDVWSYGVLMWEIITLGGRPYGGMLPSAVILYLQRGNRMLQPHNCSQELYDMMMACWNTAPSRRPTFTQLSDTLSRIVVRKGPSFDQSMERNIDERYDDITVNLGPVLEYL